MSEVGLSLVTPTRDRPEAFELCIHWMSRQTYRDPIQWIIVDDGDHPVDPNLLVVARSWKDWTIDYIRRAPTSDPCTLQDNLLAALEVVRSDKLLIIEDDEFYSPLYLEEMAWRLEVANLVGECNARYYNVRERRWEIQPNITHACLCRTGLKRPIYDLFLESIRSSKRDKDVYVDIRLWALPPAPRVPILVLRKPKFGALGELLPEPPPPTVPTLPPVPQALRTLFSNRGISIGIKGMPGRGGLGAGHRNKSLSERDSSWAKLIEWIGPDARIYMEMANRLGWKPL